MNQTTTPRRRTVRHPLNRLRTFLSKPHNVILLLMGIVVTITTIAPHRGHCGGHLQDPPPAPSMPISPARPPAIPW